MHPWPGHGILFIGSEDWKYIPGIFCIHKIYCIQYCIFYSLWIFIYSSVFHLWSLLFICILTLSTIFWEYIPLTSQGLLLPMGVFWGPYAVLVISISSWWWSCCSISPALELLFMLTWFFVLFSLFYLSKCENILTIHRIVETVKNSEAYRHVNYKVVYRCKSLIFCVKWDFMDHSVKS